MGAESRYEALFEKIKPLDELTLMDDYMFAAVMSEEENLKPLIERILGIAVGRIEFIEHERTEKEGYVSRGVRLDLYVQDEDGQVFNVEVQTSDKKNLPKRMRYYQSVVDVNILAPGVDYRDLQKSAIIFICNYDPYGFGRFIYSFENRCMEDLGLAFGDESLKVIASTKGESGDASDELKGLLRYLGGAAPMDEYTRQLDRAVSRVKASEERRHEYMVGMIHDMEVRAEGVEQGRWSTILDLASRGIITSEEAAAELGVEIGDVIRMLAEAPAATSPPA